MKEVNSPNNVLWAHARDDLVKTVVSLDFPVELGEAIARHLGSPKAIERMTAYLRYAKPAVANMIVDEMLAIRAEIDAWKEKKASVEANCQYNELLNYGLEVGDEENGD